MSKYTDLIKRLEKATGPDRELDGRIMFALFATPAGDRVFLWPEDNPSWVFAHLFDRSMKEARKGRPTIEWQREDGKWIMINQMRVPELTASIDAAVGLIERVLPGWSWYANGKGWALIYPTCPYQTYEASVSATTPPIALLIALLRALEARQ